MILSTIVNHIHTNASSYLQHMSPKATQRLSLKTKACISRDQIITKWFAHIYNHLRLCVMHIQATLTFIGSSFSPKFSRSDIYPSLKCSSVESKPRALRRTYLVERGENNIIRRQSLEGERSFQCVQIMGADSNQSTFPEQQKDIRYWCTDQ